MLKLYRSIFFTARFFALCGLLVLMALLSWKWAFLYGITLTIVIAVPFVLAADFIMLWIRKGMFARREMMEKLSNGDQNDIRIYIENKYPYPIWLKVVDELPVQFQARDLAFNVFLAPFGKKMLTYKVRPVRRGDRRVEGHL